MTETNNDNFKIKSTDDLKTSLLKTMIVNLKTTVATQESLTELWKLRATMAENENEKLQSKLDELTTK